VTRARVVPIIILAIPVAASANGVDGNRSFEIFDCVIGCLGRRHNRLEACMIGQRWETVGLVRLAIAYFERNNRHWLHVHVRASLSHQFDSPNPFVGSITTILSWADFGLVEVGQLAGLA